MSFVNKYKSKRGCVVLYTEKSRRP